MASSNTNLALEVTDRMSLTVPPILLGTHNNEKQFICPLKSSLLLKASCNNGL